MNAIEQTKHDGAVLALKRRIDDLMLYIKESHLEGVKLNGFYVCMEKDIKDAETILQQIKETFAALKEMEPENK